MSASKPHQGTWVTAASPEHAEALERLQRACFPTLGEHERMTAEHFRMHQEVFPEGEFVALSDVAPDGSPLAEPRVVGLGSGFLIDFDLENPGHTFHEVIAGGSYANHDPDGPWYYGADISVHPDYRGRGIGKRLYSARQALVRRLGRRGIVGGGMLPGYVHVRGRMTVSEYVERVLSGDLRDPTLNFQLACGFEVRGLLQGYIDEPSTHDWATLIVWENPDWKAPT